MPRFSIEHAWHASPQSPIGVSWRAASPNPEIVVEVSTEITFTYYSIGEGWAMVYGRLYEFATAEPMDSS